MLDRTIANEIGQTLEQFRRNFDNYFAGNYGNSRQVGSNEPAEAVFVPAIETGWTNDDLNLRVILPAVASESVEVTTQGNQLFIKGERKAPEYVQNEGTFYSILPYGKFERVIDLPNGLDFGK